MFREEKYSKQPMLMLMLMLMLEISEKESIRENEAFNFEHTKKERILYNLRMLRPSKKKNVRKSDRKTKKNKSQKFTRTSKIYLLTFNLFFPFLLYFLIGTVDKMRRFSVLIEAEIWKISNIKSNIK